MNWDKVNWVLNHKPTGYPANQTTWIVQQVIWRLLANQYNLPAYTPATGGFPTPQPATDNLYNQAIAQGAGFLPSAGQTVGVLMYVDGIYPYPTSVDGLPTNGQPNNYQDLMIEVPVPPGSIGDFVWQDTNQNGIQDAGEPGINGVVVKLCADSGCTNVIETTTTATFMGNGGYYQFSALTPGTYYVSIDTSQTAISGPNLVPTLTGQGTPSTDSNINPSAVTLTSIAPVDETIDFGFTTLGTSAIGDFVWQDNNANGIQDAGEPGLSGLTVNLCSDPGCSTILATTTTDQNGAYHFTGLFGGIYYVQVVPGAGFVATLPQVGFPANNATDSGGNVSGIPNEVSLPVNYTDNTIDFGFIPPAQGAIGDFVWLDLNSNGIQDAGEPGINNVTLRLYNSASTLIATTTTVTQNGQNGYYQFTGLAAGTYQVVVDTTTLPSTDSPTVSNAPGSTTANDSNGSPASVTLATNLSVDETIDFGYVAPCTGVIGDFVWYDLNENGIQDPGEPGIAGVTVNLYGPSHVFIVSTTTDANGAYHFNGLCANTYSVEVVTPTGYGPTLSNAAGSTPANDSNGSPASVTLPEDNTTDDTIDFGYVIGSISGTVYIDSNQNSLLDAGEPGIGGVTVTLMDCSGNTLATTTTAADGTYSFPTLPAGCYKISTPSTANGETLETTSPLMVTLTTGQNSTGNNFGYILQGSIKIVKDTVGGDGTFAFTSNFGVSSIATSGNTGSQTVSNLTPGGSYSISETAQTGWNSGTFNCTSGTAAAITVAAGQTTTCTITNTQQGSIKIVKNTVGGAGTFAFTSNFGVSSIGTSGNTGSQTVTGLTPGGSYSISETAQTGWNSGTFNCTSGTAAAITVVAGQTTTCTITNTQQGSIKIVKNTVGGDGTFAFTSNFGVSSIGTSGNTGSQTVSNLTPGGSYSISETAQTGWNSGTFSCTAGTAAAITVAAGQTTTCTITNTQQGSIKIVKNTVGGNGTFAFTSNFGVSSIATSGNTGSQTVSNLTPGGSYSIGETAQTGWVSGTFSCTAGTAAAITVAAGQTTTCTITNTQQGSIKIVKNTVGGNGTFAFTSNFGVSSIATSGNTGSQTVSNLTPGGSYSISETAQTGWVSGTFSCTAGTAAAITVAAGQTTTCTITNTQQGSIKIVKNTVGGNGTFAFTSNFGVSSITTSGNTGSQTVSNLTPGGSYSISETAQTGWVSGTFSCTAGTAAAITVAAGQTTTCTITNTQQGSIKIVKNTVGGNGTFAFTSNFGVSSIATSGNTGSQTVSNLTPGGSYSIGETAQTGWVSGTFSCTAGTAAAITVAAGQTTTCTITNTQQGSIKIVKNTVGGNGTFAFTSNFGVSSIATSGNTGSQTVSNLTPGGSYSISETAQTGWVSGTFSCTAGTAAAITVAAGQTTTCTITNTELAPAVAKGDTATIGFWHNKNGQALIDAVNGGSTAKSLATWLATTFPNLYGTGAGANNLTGKTNADVAALDLTFFNVSGQKTSAQILGAALACYVTSSTLAGNTAVSYGFNSSPGGTCGKTFNIGSDGTGTGLNNNQSYTVLQLLQQVNLDSPLSTAAANAFNDIFNNINEGGDIS